MSGCRHEDRLIRSIGLEYVCTTVGAQHITESSDPSWQRTPFLVTRHSNHSITLSTPKKPNSRVSGLQSMCELSQKFINLINT